MAELKITSERVLEAASKCGDAARVLKTLFPDVFNERELRHGDVTELSKGSRYVAVSRKTLETALSSYPNTELFQVCCAVGNPVHNLGRVLPGRLIGEERIIARNKD